MNKQGCVLTETNCINITRDRVTTRVSLPILWLRVEYAEVLVRRGRTSEPTVICSNIQVPIMS